MALVVGTAAINRGSNPCNLWDAGLGWTWVDRNVPANEDGIVNQVEAWFGTAAAGNSFRVGSFHDNGSNSLKCIDVEVIGEVTAGSKQTYTGLSIDFLTGEYIGCGCLHTPAVSLKLERDFTGGPVGLWYINGAHCIVDDITTYETAAVDDIFSLYGAAAPGWTGKIAGVTNPAKVMGVAVADIAKIKGV